VNVVALALLSRIPSSPQSAGPRTAHPHQRAHPQRPAQGNGVNQEEGDVEDLRAGFKVAMFQSFEALKLLKLETSNET